MHIMVMPSKSWSRHICEPLCFIKMTKQEYIKSLEEIVVDEILITDKINLIDEEISTNSWSVSANNDLIDQISIDDLLNLFNRVKLNRCLQLNQSDLEINLIFYVWFDEQACQLRFNLINSNHKSLPFETELNIVETIDEIIIDYLNSEYHDGIPLAELTEMPKDSSASKEIDDVSTIKVYEEILKKEKQKHNL